VDRRLRRVLLSHAATTRVPRHRIVTTIRIEWQRVDLSLNGTVCESAATSSYTQYRVTSTVTVTGGTGEFA